MQLFLVKRSVLLSLNHQCSSLRVGINKGPNDAILRSASFLVHGFLHIASRLCFVTVVVFCFLFLSDRDYCCCCGCISEIKAGRVFDCQHFMCKRCLNTFSEKSNRSVCFVCEDQPVVDTPWSRLYIHNTAEEPSIIGEMKTKKGQYVVHHSSIHYSLIHLLIHSFH